MSDEILLVGGYGVGNCGDEAILAGLLNQLPHDARIAAISHDPLETSRLHGVKAISPFEPFKVLKKHDRVIISGGLFSDQMGNLAKLVPLFCILSKTRGITIDFEGIGVYPSTPKLMWPLIRISSEIARGISVRDRLSVKVLDEMGVKGVSEIRDLSYSMNSSSEGRAIKILDEEGIDTSKQIIGVSITRATPALTPEVTKSIRTAIRRTDRKVEILFIPMCRHKRSVLENDYLYSEEVAKGFSDVKILSGSYHPSEILAVFGLLERCVCMRLHSMIFAHRMGTPMIPIPYTEKCLEFLKDAGINPVPIKETPKLMRGGR